MDSIVVWFPDFKILFGGCLIKSIQSSASGSYKDGDLFNWPVSVHKVKKRFPQAEIVIPGHFSSGGRELFDHTISLLNNYIKKLKQYDNL